MKSLNTDFYCRCLNSLQRGLSFLEENREEDDTLRDIYRSACVKEFEILLEQSGKLLKKCLKPYFAISKEVDKLTFNDIFRHAGKVSLLSLEEVDRWLHYRKVRNSTAHDYGESFAEETLLILPDFIKDAIHIEKVFRSCFEKEY